MEDWESMTITSYEVNQNVPLDYLLRVNHTERERKNNNVVLPLNEEKINELKKMYELADQKLSMLSQTLQWTREEDDTNMLEDESEGSERSEGSRKCGFIIE
jgi:hypothetical protein